MSDVEPSERPYLAAGQRWRTSGGDALIEANADPRCTGTGDLFAWLPDGRRVPLRTGSPAPDGWTLASAGPTSAAPVEREGPATLTPERLDELERMAREALDSIGEYRIVELGRDEVKDLAGAVLELVAEVRRRGSTT